MKIIIGFRCQLSTLNKYCTKLFKILFIIVITMKVSNKSHEFQAITSIE